MSPAIRACWRPRSSRGRDPVCDELPAVLIVRRNDPDHPVEPQEIIDLLARKFARWQLPLPEDIHFVESLPKTGVGKIDKKALRKLVADQLSGSSG